MKEADYWRQRYEMLMANFGDAIKAAVLPPPPTILADKESYEAGRIAGMQQSKPWVGLTDGDMYEIGEFKNTHGYVPTGFKRLAAAIEAKLKEKNQ